MPKDTKLPPEHIGNIPAGDARNEEIKRRQDELEMRAEADEAASEMGAIDERKFKNIDNEVARHIGHDGKVHISNMQKGYRYCFITHAQDYQGEARSAVRTMHHKANAAGYHYVQGDDPEARELIGNDCASGTTLRGWGDTILARIREEDAQLQDARMEEKTRRNGAVEENLVSLGVRNFGPAMRGLVEGAAGNFDPRSRLGRAFPAEAGQSVSYSRVTSTFDEGDIRRGSIPGMPAPGAR